MKAGLLPMIVASLSSGALAPAAAAAAAADPIKATYTCDAGQSLDVVFEDGKATVTPKGGEAVTLPQAVTADGFQYSDATHNLRGRGDDATWTVGSGEPLNCTAQPAAERG